MNKKIMSFVLAMVLSVGLGSSLFAATPKGTSNQTNSGIATSSGTASGLSAAASDLAGHISHVFHYESGILVSATGADGSVTIYDQGRYRGTMAMGLDGTYTWSNLAFYGSDYDTIVEHGGIDQFLLDIGVKPEQLKGGGEEEVNFLVVDVDEKMKAQLDKEGYTIEKADDGKYYKYTTKVDDEEVTKILTEAEYNGLKDEEKAKCEEAKQGSVMKAHKDKVEPQRLKWLDSALDQLSKGQNYSITVDFSAAQGAAVTFNIDGKAMQTFAWDNALTTYYDYNAAGMTTYSLQKGVDLRESLETGKAQTEDKWVAQVTVGGKVLGVYDAEQTSTGFKVTGGVSSKDFTYNADGTIQSVLDKTTNQTTHYVANKVTSITGPLKDANGNTKTDPSGNPIMATIAFYSYYDNGLINTVESNGVDGSITTTAFINNKGIVTYNGTADLANVMRANTLKLFSIVDEAAKTGKVPESVVIDSRIKNISWQPEQLAKIYNNGNWNNAALSAFIKVCGWDESNGNNVVQKTKDLISNTLQNTNWLSQAMTITYSSTAYGQTEIDSMEGGSKTTRLPANKFASSITTYNRGVAYAEYNFSNWDPSVSRAYYLFVNDTFNTGNSDYKKMLKELGITFSDTMSKADFEAAIDKISNYLCNMIEASVTYKDKNGKTISAEEYNKLSDENKKKYTASVSGVKETKSGNTSTFTHPTIEKIRKMFKPGKFGEFYATLTHETINSTRRSSTFPGGTNYYTTDKDSTSDLQTKRNELMSTFAKQMAALTDKIKNYFLDAKSNVTSGNFESLQHACSSTIEGWKGEYKATTVNTTTVTWVDPGVVGDVTGFYTAEDGTRYAILENVKVDVGTGFQSGDKEKIYVQIDEETYNDLKAKMDKGEKVSYAAAGYIGEDIDGNLSLVNTYASKVGTDVEELTKSFEVDLANNETFQANMAENRDKFAQVAGFANWAEAQAAGGISVDWKTGWDIVRSSLDQAKAKYRLDDKSGAIVPNF